MTKNVMTQRVNILIGATLVFSVGLAATFILVQVAQLSASDIEYLSSVELAGYEEDVY